MCIYIYIYYTHTYLVLRERDVYVYIYIYTCIYVQLKVVTEKLSCYHVSERNEDEDADQTAEDRVRT